MITVSHNKTPYHPLSYPIKEVVFLTLPVFKDVCLHLLQKYATHNIDYHFAYDRTMLHDILPNLDAGTSLLISLGTSVIVTKEELSCFAFAYNFHPASPEYPGSYPYHFALLEGAAQYGSTCHEMDEYIDHGPIVYVNYFDVESDDTSMTLLQKSLHHLFSMMENLFHMFFVDQSTPLPQGIEWSRRMFTEKKFKALCQLSSSVTKENFERLYHSLQSNVEQRNLVLHFHGHTFRYEGPVTADVIDLFAEIEELDLKETLKNNATFMQAAG